MNHGLTNVTVDRIRAVLASFPEVEKAVLYGSRAKGNYKRGSDIDLTLFGSTLNAGVLSRINDQLDDLLLPYKIDISIFANIRHPDLIEHIQHVGVTFYEKQTTAAAKG
jgi:predicted nucleotidyltransferase